MNILTRIRRRRLNRAVTKLQEVRGRIHDLPLVEMVTIEMAKLEKLAKSGESG